MFKEVHELKTGEFFIWEQYPEELHQKTGEKDHNNSPICNNVAVCNDGKWRFLKEDRPTNWNPFTSVRVVTIEVK